MKSKDQPVTYIKQIGIELEGGWKIRPNALDINVVGDGSVHMNNCICGARDKGESCDGSKCLTYIGECISIPQNSVKDMIKWVEKYYPDKSNKTCSMHIHISTIDKLSYMRLMSRTFYNYFISTVTKWGVENKINEGTIFWERLTGQNHFCVNKFTPETQYKVNGKDSDIRYTHLNYCYNVHKTLECRLFPAFQKKELSLSAIQCYADIIDSFLHKPIKEKPIFKTITEDQDESSIRRSISCV